MTAIGQDTLGTRETLNVGGKAYGYYSLARRLPSWAMSPACPSR